LERREEKTLHDPYHCVGVEGGGVHYFSAAMISIKLYSRDKFNTICFWIIRILMMNVAKKVGRANNAER
jgi:hypothetical protein